jgi:hypothetical protein
MSASETRRAQLAVAAVASTAAECRTLLDILGLRPAPVPDGPCCRGDRTGYQRHLRHSTPPCDASRAANTAYCRTRTGAVPLTAADCGTYAGYQMHVRHGEPPCDDCAEARRKRDREYHADHKAEINARRNTWAQKRRAAA